VTSQNVLKFYFRRIKWPIFLSEFEVKPLPGLEIAFLSSRFIIAFKVAPLTSDPMFDVSLGTPKWVN